MNFRILFLIIIIPTVLFSQKKVDSRIINFLGKKKVEYYKQKYPDSLKYFEYYVRNGFRIVENCPKEKTILLPDISEMSKKYKKYSIEKLKRKFNVLKHNKSKRDYRVMVAFKIGNTGSVIELRAMSDINISFKNYMKQKNKKR